MYFRQWPCSIVILTLLTLATVECTRSPFDIVRYAGNGTMYLLFKGVAKAVPDELTASALSFTPTQLRSIDEVELSKYRIGPAVPIIAKSDGSPDDITRVELQKSFALMGHILCDIHHIGEYMNPAVVKWRNRLLLVTGSNYGRANTKTTKNAFLEFRWLNDSFLPFADDQALVGITTGEVEMLDREAFGEDPRVLVLSDDRLMVFYAYPFQALTRIGLLEVAVNAESQKAQIVTLHSSIHPTVDFSMRHKNWAPFRSQDGAVLMVQNINPLVVVKPVVRPEDGAMQAELVSSASALELHWTYGVLRGGTNAVYLQDRGVYLAFFHSKCNFPGNYMSSYVAGAYTFTAEAPYRLLTLSALPIMAEAFYTGPWSPLRNARIDYCFFPTAIHLDGAQQIVMSAGFQDHSGFLMKLDLQAVLDTMVDVN
jgi:hypothetical protein